MKAPAAAQLGERIGAEWVPPAGGRQKARLDGRSQPLGMTTCEFMPHASAGLFEIGFRDPHSAFSLATARLPGYVEV